LKTWPREKELISSGTTSEVERCQAAPEHATQGNLVFLVSSGDAGIYGMAGLAMELNNSLQLISISCHSRCAVGYGHDC
jgi:precorrin-3B C17-methyltransferase